MVDSLQNKLGYVYRDVSLLSVALTHRSHSAQHNERLEFLGDSILNAVIGGSFTQNSLMPPEGDLSRLRANLVRQDSLCIPSRCHCRSAGIFVLAKAS